MRDANLYYKGTKVSVDDHGVYMLVEYNIDVEVEYADINKAFQLVCVEGRSVGHLTGYVKKDSNVNGVLALTEEFLLATMKDFFPNAKNLIINK